MVTVRSIREKANTRPHESLDVKYGCLMIENEIVIVIRYRTVVVLDII